MSFGPSPDLSGNVTAMAVCVDCTGAATGNPMRFQNYGGPTVFVGDVGAICAFGAESYPSSYPVIHTSIANQTSYVMQQLQDPDNCPDCS